MDRMFNKKNYLNIFKPSKTKQGFLMYLPLLKITSHTENKYLPIFHFSFMVHHVTQIETLGVFMRNYFH